MIDTGRLKTGGGRQTQRGNTGEINISEFEGWEEKKTHEEEETRCCDEENADEGKRKEADGPEDGVTRRPSLHTRGCATSQTIRTSYLCLRFRWRVDVICNPQLVTL